MTVSIHVGNCLSNYSAFIESKRARLDGPDHRIAVRPEDIHPALFAFQRDIVIRALAMGSAALFEDCGMGKTIQSLEWARHVHARTDRPVLVLTPLAVGPQMAHDAALIDIPVALCRKQSDMGESPIAITNYEMVHHFDPAAFGGLVLDESSILKNMFGKVRRTLIEFAVLGIPYRLAATATPAPNDLIEVLNHAAYLGRMSVKEALAMWFTQDDQVQYWRLKGYAVADFWQWVQTWAIAARKPDDIGYRMEGYDLPPLDVHDHILAAPDTARNDGHLFASVASLSDHRHIRRESLSVRVAECAEIVNPQ